MHVFLEMHKFKEDVPFLEGNLRYEGLTEHFVEAMHVPKFHALSLHHGASFAVRPPGNNITFETTADVMLMFIIIHWGNY